MAIITNIRGSTETLYKGCVMWWFEKNGYHDSDWYAVVWDEEKQEVIEFEYQTTRAAVYGSAEIDITDENLMKAFEWFLDRATRRFDYDNERQAKRVHKGKLCKVTRGRKVPPGTIGEVFWIGETKHGERVGIITASGTKHFVPTHYIEVVDPEKYLLSGCEREMMIQKNALSYLPKMHRDRVKHILRESLKDILGEPRD